jgi:hypothetical protein
LRRKGARATPCISLALAPAENRYINPQKIKDFIKLLYSPLKIKTPSKN